MLEIHRALPVGGVVIRPESTIIFKILPFKGLNVKCDHIVKMKIVCTKAAR